MAKLPIGQSIVSEVHAARRILLSGNPGEAAERLRSYETIDYATLNIVLGECYYSLGDFRKAREQFKQALRHAPNSPRAEILLELSTSMLDLERVASPAPLSILPTNSEDDNSDIGQLARKLSEASSTELNTDVIAPILSAPQSDEIGLVSETLAKIMIQQGKFEEARKVYIQLSRLNPNRYDYFREQMDELDRIKDQ